MIAAAIRTIFAQPTGAEVVDQLDKVAAMLQPKFPAVAAMPVDASSSNVTEVQSRRGLSGLPRCGT